MTEGGGTCGPGGPWSPGSLAAPSPLLKFPCTEPSPAGSEPSDGSDGFWSTSCFISTYRIKPAPVRRSWWSWRSWRSSRAHRTWESRQPTLARSTGPPWVTLSSLRRPTDIQTEQNTVQGHDMQERRQVSEISVSRDKKRHDRNQRKQRNCRRAQTQYLTPAYTPWRMEKSKRRAP